MRKKVLCMLLMLSIASVAFAQNLDENWRDSIAILFVNYYSSETWEDASKHVMEPERVKYLMQLEYQDTGFPSRLLSKEEIKHDYCMRKIQGRNHIIYRCIRLDKSEYFVIKTDDGYRIDWEASCLSSPSMEIIKDSPNNEFEIKTTLYVADLTNDKWNRYGSDFWVKKNTPIDNALFKLLKNGGKHMLVKIKYVTVEGKDYDKSCPVNRRESDMKPYFTITEIISSNYSKY